MLASILFAASLAAAPADADLRAVARLKGEPQTVAAAGLTKADAPILTIENGSAFDPQSPLLRLVIVGAPDDDGRNAHAVVEAVRWFKTRAPGSVRKRWAVSVLPSAAFDAGDTAQLERWITFQAPDVLVEIGPVGGPARSAAFTTETTTAGDAAEAIARLFSTTPRRSALHDAMTARVGRAPLDIARLLARRYPETPALSYIPSVAWTSTLRLARALNDPSLTAKVREQASSLVKDGRLPFGNRIQLTAVAGTMVFAELGGGDLPHALEGARLAAARNDRGLAEYGQGWTDDMFMTSAILARAGSLPEHRDDLTALSRLLVDYAGRLQRPDGVFMHATDGPFAWGRGNGFAALGLMEALTALPQSHPDRAKLLAIFTRQMAGVAAQQSPDGSWRQVIDEPGAYREETATAMLLSAMARGIRLGWIGRQYLPVVERAWRALAAHVREDGTLVDVCTGTGAGPTRRYYLDRQAITGADDRGGAMALLASMEMMDLVAVRRPSSRPRGASSSAPRTVR